MRLEFSESNSECPVQMKKIVPGSVASLLVDWKKIWIPEFGIVALVSLIPISSHVLWVIKCDYTANIQLDTWEV